MKVQFLILFIVVILLPLAAQEESTDVRAGNKLYKSEKYVDAEVAYRKGLPIETQVPRKVRSSAEIS